jgi:hypothetical protein
MTRSKWTGIPLEAGGGGVFFRRGGPDHAVPRGLNWGNPCINALLCHKNSNASSGMHGLE